MSEIPFYFGPSAQPIFGWLHIPDGRITGGVVLCPAIGMEELSAHPAYRHLSQQLSSQGIVALRFDYPGTGDSAGDLESSGILDRWRQSIDAAIDVLHNGGVDRVGVIGLRLGAVLASEIPDRSSIDALVMWDPIASGRAYLRGQRALRDLSIPVPPVEDEGGSVELIGVVVSRQLAEDVARLRLEKAQLADTPTLVLLREESLLPDAVLDSIVRGSAVELRSIKGQPEFLDVLPDEAVMPMTSLDDIIEWFLAKLAGESTDFQLASRHEQAVLELGSGETIMERPVIFGESRLFGLLSEPIEAQRGVPSVVFLNAGLLHHVGPARLWVTLARRLAAQGVRVFRFDIGGIGDSPPHVGARARVSYPSKAVADIAEAMQAIESGPNDVVLAGLCAGAYHSIEAGIAFSIRGACAINPILTFSPSEIAIDGTDQVGRQAVQPYGTLIRRLRQNKRLRDIGERFIPPLVWEVLDRLGLQPAPGRSLVRLNEMGVKLLLVCGELEALQFVHRSPRQMKILQGRDGFSFAPLPGIDHALLAERTRAKAVPIIERYLLDITIGNKEGDRADAAVG